MKAPEETTEECQLVWDEFHAELAEGGNQFLDEWEEA